MAQYLTRDPDVVRAWADARGAKPCTVASARSKEHPGLIRLVLPGDPIADPANEISWGVWFSKFLENDLVLLYEDDAGSGKTGAFHRLLTAGAAEALDGDWRGDGANSSGLPRGSSEEPDDVGPTAR